VDPRRHGVDDIESEWSMNAASLTVKVFADGANIAGIAEMAADPFIQGFTTNPTLMRVAGVQDYPAFAREVLQIVTDRPISFEVFSDEIDEMERQANLIAGWADNVYVKIPITNTEGVSTAPLLDRLSAAGVKANVTGLLTLDQVKTAAAAMAGATPGCVSVFAGRVADSGTDPVPLMTSAVEILSAHPNLELIWASPRELLNIVQADEIGCHIITVTNDLLKKLPLLGKDHTQFSRETVQMFRRDAVAAGYTLS
jgi:transaldolase